MISVAHALCGAAAALLLWRALAQVWVDELTSDVAAREALRLALPFVTAAGSALAVVAGRFTSRPRRFFALDAWSFGVLLAIVFALTLGRLDREWIGVLFVLALAVRLAPALAAAVADAPLPFLFATAFTAYAALAAWHQAAALPLGDQVHYLLAADRLAHGSVDGTIDASLFQRLSTLTPSDLDIGTHVLDTPVGPRTIQGYALPLVLLPGWLAAGRLGAELVVALVAAWASVMTALILRDTIASSRVRGAVWAMTTFLAPGVLLAFHVYPNVFGAAAIATGYRFGITAPNRRPLLAGVAAGLVLFLNPRDGLLLVVLLVAMWWIGRRDFWRFALGAAAVAIVASVADAALYAFPLPYAGYLIGTAHAQQLTHESTLTFAFWIGLPAMLFDRTFGVAGVAPWLFLAVVGLPAALHADRRRLLPAAVAVGLSLVALSIYRYWEGGYAPSARYFVDMLPLFAPFVGYGFLVMRPPVARAAAGLLVGVSVLTTVVLCAMPSRALNDAFQQQLQDVLDQILAVNPVGWLPSFQPTTPDWYVGAYLRLVPAVAILAALAVYGWRRRTDDPVTRAPSDRAVIAGFVVANAVALAVTLVAVTRPWLADVGDLPVSLATRWLPLVLVITSAVAVAIGLHLDPVVRRGFFARHFAVYLAVPLVLLVLRSQFVVNQEVGAVYLLIAVVFAANALHAVWTASTRLPDVRTAVLLGATMLATALVVLPYDGTLAPTASDEPHYLLIVQSIVFDRDLDLANDYAGDRYLGFYPEPLPDVHGIHVGDAIYPIRDLGLPALAVIPYALAERLGVLALLSLFGALLAAQLYLLLRDLAFDRRVALAAAAVTVFVHPFLTYTTQIYPDLIAAVMFVSIARLLRAGARTPVRNLALASAFTGTLPWLTTRSWPIVVAVGLVIAYCALWERRELVRRLVAGAAPFAALVLALCYVNWRMFALFLPSAGYFLVRGQQEVIDFSPETGIPGLLFDRAFGLVPRAPIYLLAFVGVAALWRRRRSAELIALFAGWAAYLLFIADVAYWHADGGPPSRYLLAGLPFLVVAVAGGLETILGVTGRARAAAVAFAWIAAAWSAFVTFVYAVEPGLRYEYMPQIQGGASVKLWDELGKVLRPDVQLALPSFFGTERATIPLALFWVAVAVALVYVGTRLRRASA